MTETLVEYRYVAVRPGEGIRALEFEQELTPDVQARVKLIVQANEAIERHDLTEIRRLMTECCTVQRIKMPHYYSKRLNPNMPFTLARLQEAEKELK